MIKQCDHLENPGPGLPYSVYVTAGILKTSVADEL